MQIIWEWIPKRYSKTSSQVELTAWDDIFLLSPEITPYIAAYWSYTLNVIQRKLSTCVLPK